MARKTGHTEMHGHAGLPCVHSAARGQDTQKEGLVGIVWREGGLHEEVVLAKATQLGQVLVQLLASRHIIVEVGHPKAPAQFPEPFWHASH